MSPRPRLKQGMLAGVAVIALLLASAIAYAGSVTYTYDSLNRLTKAEYEDGRVIQYDYDAAGNRTVLYDSATPPITTAEPPGGYYNSTRSVCLTSHDFSGHGINKTFYCTGSQCSPTTECSSCIINISSTTTLRFYSTDLAGNSEPVKTEVYNFDTTPPSNPTSCSETYGSMNDTWQNSVSDPAFTWSGASDSGGSGVKGYNWYFGMDSNGTPATWTTGEGCDPSAVSSGTYYLRVKTEDNAGNQSSPATLFTLKYDTIAPTGTISINSGAGCTNDANVTLTLGCSDTGGSGCSKMKFSNDGSSYSAEEDYNTSKQWPLDSTSNGPKTVYVKYKDAAGNWSDAFPDDITLSLPVRILRTPLVPYTSIQTAYNAAQTGDTIQCQVFPFDEDLTVNRDISVTLEGGYDCGYTTNSGATTSIKGKIQTTPGGGTLTMGNIGNFVLATE